MHPCKLLQEHEHEQEHLCQVDRNRVRAFDPNQAEKRQRTDDTGGMKACKKPKRLGAAESRLAEPKVMAAVQVCASAS